jgi:RNA polymerase sigma-70 factor (sigma-E family)
VEPEPAPVRLPHVIGEAAVREGRAEAEPSREARARPQPATLADLYREQYRPMVRLAYLLVGSVPLAEDLVQDAFARLHRKWDTVEHRQAYLRTAVVNACRSHHRHARVVRARRQEPAPAPLAAEDEPLWDVLGRLPARQRAALVLRFYEDRSEAEIAAILGCRPGTVKSLLHRGLGELRKRVER